MRLNGLFLLLTMLLLPLQAPARSVQPLSPSETPQEQALPDEFGRIRAHLDSIRAHRPTVAVVLSGGGAKGAAQVGALRYLDEQGIPVDVVMGTSMGGFLSGIYAVGHRGQDLEDIISGMDWTDMVLEFQPRRYQAMKEKQYRDHYLLSLPFGFDGERNRSIIPQSLSHGQNMRNFVSSVTVGYQDEMDFTALPTPLITVSTDMVTAHPKLWAAGSIQHAMLSTFAVPGLFPPVRTDGMILSDGAFHNNFPADIAEEIGADIIIGLDVSAPRATYEQIDHAGDILMQVFDMLGMDNFRESLLKPDIRIRPDISGYDMMNFDKASIDTLLVRGKEGMEPYRKDLMEVKRRVGEVTSSPRPPARNLFKERVAVSEIIFEGIDEKERDYLVRLGGIDPANPGLIGRDELEALVWKIRGTRVFSSVTYRFEGSEEPYRVHLDFVRSPENLAGVSLRFDTYDYASLLLNLGLKTLRRGFSFDATGRLGHRSSLEMNASWRSWSGLDLSLGGSIVSQDHNRFGRGEEVEERDFFRGRGQARVSTSLWNTHHFFADLVFDYLRFKEGWSGTLVRGRVGIEGDTFDNAYFPHKGLRYRVTHSSFFVNPAGFMATEASIRGAVPLGERFAFLPYAAGRMLFREAELPFFLSNAMAPRMQTPAFEQQIPFVGIDRPVFTQGDMLLTGGADFRFEVSRGQYMTLVSGLGLTWDDLSMPFDRSRLFGGLALEYGIDFVSGPLIRADVHWSNLSGVGLSLCLGLDF